MRGPLGLAHVAIRPLPVAPRLLTDGGSRWKRPCGRPTLEKEAGRSAGFGPPMAALPVAPRGGGDLPHHTKWKSSTPRLPIFTPLRVIESVGEAAMTTVLPPD